MSFYVEYKGLNRCVGCMFTGFWDMKLLAEVIADCQTLYYNGITPANCADRRN